MPAKNRIKQYVENGYYHLYNRGVAKGEVFLDDQDYRVFLAYLKEYLSPPVPPSAAELKAMTRPYIRCNYYQEVELLSFCLMANHFHFLLKQRSSRSVEHLMRSLITRYTIYFNKRYQRVGYLFQSVYKGILVDREGYFLWLSRYIHRNPLAILPGRTALSKYPFSSYPVYLGRQKMDWLRTGEVLANFKNYQSFVESAAKDEPEDLGGYLLDQQ